MRKILSFLTAILFAGSMMAADYVKVTEAPTDWSGDYLFVYEAENVAFNGGLATLDAAANTIAVEITDGKIAATDATNAAKFTLAAVEGGYSVQSASGKFIGVGSYGNGLKQADAVGSYVHNSLSIDENGNAIIGIYNASWNTTGGTMILNFNANKSDKRFRYYKDGSQKKIQLYKYVAEATQGGEEPVAVETKTIYCSPFSEWHNDGARFAVYALGDGENTAWYDLVAVEGAENVYSAEIAEAFPTVIFCRMNGATTENNWDNKWNQTADLALPTDGKNLYTITGWNENDGTWSVYGEGGDDPEPVDPTPAEKDSIYFVNVAGWTAPRVHLWGGTAAGTEWPGVEMTKLDDQINNYDVYKYVADKGAYVNCIFSDNGENQTADLDWTSGKYFYNDAWYALNEIPAPLPDAVPLEGNIWKVTVETPLVAGSHYINEALLTMDGVYATTLKTNTRTIAGEEFTHAIQVRTDGYPTAENKAGKEKSGSTSLIITAKEDADVTFYYNRQVVGEGGTDNDNKDLIVFDQADITTKIAGVFTIDQILEGNNYMNVTKKVALKKDHTYTVTASGTTLQLHGIKLEAHFPVMQIAGAWNVQDEAWLLNDMSLAEDKLTATYEVELAKGDYEFKMIKDGAWLTKANEGQAYGLHRAWPGVAGVIDNATENLKVTADVAGNYVFTWTFANDSIGIAFPEAPIEPTPNYYIIGAGEAFGEWSFVPVMQDTFKLSNLEAGDYMFRIAFEEGNWENTKGYSDLTEKTEGLSANEDNNILFTLAEASDVAVVYNDTVFRVIGNFYVAPKVAYYLIGDSAFVVDAGATADKAWTPDAIPCLTDTTVLNLKAGVDYIMRLSLNGTWENHRDFRHLTDTAAGLIELLDEYGNHSIGFRLAEAGEVKVVYIAAAEEQPEVFKLIGDFYVYVPQFTDGYYLVGNQYNWTPAAERLFKANPETAGEYFLDSVVLAADDSLKVVYVENDQLLNWYPEGNNYVVDANRAGTKTIYFNPTYQKEWGGNIFIAENPAPKEYYAKYAEAWEWVKLTEAEGLWLTDTIVYKGTGININDKAADEDNLFYSNEEIEGALPIAGAEFKLNDTIRFSFNPADSVVTAIMIAEYVAPDPTVSVKGSMNDWAEEIPFVLSDDKTYASLTVENISAGNYDFKFVISGEWRSNGYRYHRGFPGAAGITENNDANMIFQADVDGEYTFYWYFANDSAAIVYPELPFTCDWENIAWLDGSNEQIKVCKESEAVSVINVQKPSWAAEKGIYMTFPSAAWGAISLEEGSYVTEGAGLLVYLSALTQEYNEISIVCQDVEYIINVYNADNMPKPAFYLVGNFNEWTAAEAYKFALNPNNDAEYVLTATLAEKDSLKVIRVMEGEETVWYPADAENYVVDAAHAGEKDIYFRPDYQGGEDWYAQCIYVAENAPQGCDWDHIDFIGSAVPELADQFKLCKEGQYPNVINIQNSFGTEAGIYVTFPSAAFGEISMTEGTYAIQGAGMLLYCSAFTDVETEVSIVCDGNPIIFTVYNAEGSAPVVDPTVSVKGSMNDWAEEIPFVLSDDKTYASLTVENISAGNYEFKFIINGEWRSNGYRYHRGFPGAAGITENNEANMTFEADIDGEYTFYWYFANDSAAIVYPAKPEPVLANGYYLVGSMNEWTPAAENLLAQNPDNEAEYQLAINLAVGDEIKVVEVENDEIKTWFPAEGDNYLVDGNHAGATTMYFRPDYQGGEDWFAGCIFIVPTSHTDIDNVNAAVEAVKIIRDGQLFIIKGEKMYNVMGQTIK